MILLKIEDETVMSKKPKTSKKMIHGRIKWEKGELKNRMNTRILLKWIVVKEGKNFELDFAHRTPETEGEKVMSKTLETSKKKAHWRIKWEKSRLKKEEDKDYNERNNV